MVFTRHVMANRTRSILIVEDDLDTREMLRRRLAQEGYTVHVAADGWAGLLAVNGTAPDLILLDIMLPGMDGVAFLRSLRGQTVGRDIPVVVVTALDPVDVVDKVRSLGVTHILPKNGTLFPSLKDTIERVIAAAAAHEHDIGLPQPRSVVPAANN